MPTQRNGLGDAVMQLCLRAHQLLLITALDDIDEHELGDDELEGGFAHGFNWVAKEAEVGFVTTFRNK